MVRVLLCLVLLSCGCVAPFVETTASRSEPAELLEVHGYGKVFYEVDTADIRFSVSVRDPDVQTCKKNHDAIIEELVAYLRREGYAPDTLSLEESSLARQKSRKPEDAHYLSKSTYALRTARIAELRSFQADVVQLGVDEIEQVELFSMEQRELEDRARAAALADAKQKAEAVAEELGWTLGAPMKIQFTERGSRGFGSRSSAASGSSSVAAAGNFVDAMVRVYFAYEP